MRRKPRHRRLEVLEVTLLIVSLLLVIALVLIV